MVSEACWIGSGETGVPLPCARADEYNYQIDAGLARVQMASGYFRQRRRYTHRPHYLSLSWVVNSQSLAVLEAGLDAYGYSGLYLPIITGANGRPYPVDHLVRLTGPLDVTLADKDLWQVRVSAEIQSLDSTCLWESEGCTWYYETYLKNIYFPPVEILTADWNALANAWGNYDYWGWP